MKKYNIQKVNDYVSQFKYLCTSVTYQDTSEKLNFICPNGHNISMSLSNFMYNKRRCSFCAGNNTCTLSDVLEFLNKFGYKCESTNYKNSTTKLDLICPLEHKFKLSFSEFKNQNIRCSVCYGTPKYTIQFVEDYVNKYNYKLISTDYISNRKHLELECPNNHICKISFSNFKNHNRRCKECSLLNHSVNFSGPKHPLWNPNREEIKLNRRLRKSLTKQNINKYLKYDDNYNDYVKYPSNYQIDHIIPISIFSKFVLHFNLNETIVKKIINGPNNLQILTVKNNKHKKDSGSIFAAAQYLMLNDIRLIKK